MIGYSLSGPPRPPVDRLIHAIQGKRVVSLDVLSGLEVRTGQVHEPFVRAEVTVALAVPSAACSFSRIGWPWATCTSPISRFR